MKGSEKINALLEHFSLSPSDFAKKLELKYVQNIYDIQSDKVDISKSMANKIVAVFNDVDKNWLLTGEGKMLKEEKSGVQFYDPENAPPGRRLIPLYDDGATTIGGNLKRGRSANMQSNTHPTEWIDPGDWFKNVTAAIRHYEDSMIEYPSGCVLALKEVQDRMLLIPGKDYVIETTENRVTKKIQLGADDTYIRCHSTNTETYPDGTLIHQPFNIRFENILKIFEVLGYVVKKGGGTMVFTNQK